MILEQVTLWNVMINAGNWILHKYRNHTNNVRIVIFFTLRLHINLLEGSAETIPENPDCYRMRARLKSY